MSIEELTRDHIIPVSKKWSSNGIDNMQPLCSWCNKMKANQVIDFRPDHSSVVPELLTGHLKGVWKKLNQTDKNGVALLPTHQSQQQKTRKIAITSTVEPEIPKQLRIQKEAHQKRITELHEVHQALYKRCHDAEAELVELHLAYDKLPCFLKILMKLYGWKMALPTGEVEKRLRWRKSKTKM